MNQIKETYQFASDIVKKIERLLVVGNNSIGDLFTISGIPYWKILESTLAVNHLVHKLNCANSMESPQVKRLSKLKSKVFEWSLSRFVFRTAPAHLKSPNSCLLLGFTTYITKESVVPLVSHLRQTRNLDPFLLTDGCRNRLPSRQSDVEGGKSLWSYWDRGSLKQYSGILSQLKDRHAIIIRSRLFREQVTDAFGSFDQRILETLDLFFLQMLSRIAAYHVLAERIIDEIQPRVLVSSDVNDARMRMFGLVGRNRGIPTMELQFSIYDENSVEWQFLESESLALTGRRNKEILERLGVPTARMSITGSSRFDNIRTLETFVHENHILKPKQKSILFASQPNYFGAFATPEIRNDMIKAFVRIFAQYPSHVLMVKPHPVENEKELRAFFQGLPNVIFVSKKEPIRNYIHTADAFVTFYSSSAFDALALEKPTLGLAFGGSNSNHLIFDGDPYFVASNEQMIEVFLQNVLEGRDPSFLDAQKNRGKEILDSWFFCSDGYASCRIESLLLQLASQQSKDHHASKY